MPAAITIETSRTPGAPGPTQPTELSSPAATSQLPGTAVQLASKAVNVAARPVGQGGRQSRSELGLGGSLLRPGLRAEEHRQADRHEDPEHHEDDHQLHQREAAFGSEILPASGHTVPSAPRFPLNTPPGVAGGWLRAAGAARGPPLLRCDGAWFAYVQAVASASSESAVQLVRSPVAVWP